MPVPLSPDLVRATLERILADPGFANAERLRRLLRFLVEETLAGRADDIKEYVLGMEVFDRGDGYDPRLDSIVRVEVRRLRSKLDEYYHGAGASDPIRVHIRRGSYVPEFETRPGPMTQAAPAPLPDETTAEVGAEGALTGAGAVADAAEPRVRWRARAAAAVLACAVLAAVWQAAGPRGSAAGTPPRVAVLPIEHYPRTDENAALADRLTGRVITALVRTGEVEIVSQRSAAQFPRGARSTRDIGAALGATLLVEGTLEREASDRVRLDARLVDPERDRKVWAETFSASHDALDVLERQLTSALAEAIATHATKATR